MGIHGSFAAAGCKILIICLAILTFGCGTTHQFLPPKPLEKKEWMVSVTWHYDLGRLSRPSILPEVNAYQGLGKGFNFGFGAALPFLINHITFTRYYETADHNWWAAYIHANGLYSGVNNPSLELGGSYIDVHNSFDQQFMFGLSYGYCRGDLFTFEDSFWDDKSVLLWRFLPFIKYTGMGRDLGFSWQHYFGLNRTALGSLRYRISNTNDTLYALQASEIDSVVVIEDYREFSGCPICEKYMAIYLTNDELISFCESRSYPDVFVIPYRELQYWLGKDYRVLHCCSDHLDENIILSPDSLITAWHAGQDLIITRYPEELADRINNLNSLFLDNSFGLGIISYSSSGD